MSLEHTARAVAGRLSPREPQAESRRRLASALELVPALRDHRVREPNDLKAMVEALKGLFPTLTEFARDFPSFCFALATGVGKTRLIGAFISYLYSAYGTKHFFVLAPNLTIYDKLIRDFTQGTFRVDGYAIHRERQGAGTVQERGDGLPTSACHRRRLRQGAGGRDAAEP